MGFGVEDVGVGGGLGRWRRPRAELGDDVVPEGGFVGFEAGLGGVFGGGGGGGVFEEGAGFAFAAEEGGVLGEDERGRNGDGAEHSIEDFGGGA